MLFANPYFEWFPGAEESFKDALCQSSELRKIIGSRQQVRDFADDVLKKSSRAADAKLSTSEYTCDFEAQTDYRLQQIDFHLMNSIFDVIRQQRPRGDIDQVELLRTCLQSMSALRGMEFLNPLQVSYPSWELVPHVQAMHFGPRVYWSMLPFRMWDPSLELKKIFFGHPTIREGTRITSPAFTRSGVDGLRLVFHPSGKYDDAKNTSTCGLFLHAPSGPKLEYQLGVVNRHGQMFTREAHGSCPDGDCLGFRDIAPVCREGYQSLWVMLRGCTSS
jgi:hypothetical protein